MKHFCLGCKIINMHLVPMIPPTHSHSDIDECSSANECHLDATCTNTKGSYNCTCQDGFEGDGKNCTGKILLKSITTKSLQEKNLQKANYSSTFLQSFWFVTVLVSLFSNKSSLVN